MPRTAQNSGVSPICRDDLQPPQSTDLKDWLGAGQLALSLIDSESGQMVQQAMLELVASDLELKPTALFSVTPNNCPHKSSSVIRQPASRACCCNVFPRPRRPLKLRSAVTMMPGRLRLRWWVLCATTHSVNLRNSPPKTCSIASFTSSPVALHPPRNLTYACTCSRAKSDRTLLTLGMEELQEILDELGHIQVDCEFCGRRYAYQDADIAALGEDQANRQEPGSGSPLH